MTSTAKIGFCRIGYSYQKSHHILFLDDCEREMFFCSKNGYNYLRVTESMLKTRVTETQKYYYKWNPSLEPSA